MIDKIQHAIDTAMDIARSKSKGTFLVEKRQAPSGPAIFVFGKHGQEHMHRWIYDLTTIYGDNLAGEIVKLMAEIEKDIFPMYMVTTGTGPPFRICTRPNGRLRDR